MLSIELTGFVGSHGRRAVSRFIIVPTVLATLFVAGPTISQQQTSLDREALRIGATMSITGKAYSVQGRYGREGYMLCQKHLNAQGGLLGRPVNFLIYD